MYFLHKQRNLHSAFTLIELLVVIAIIAILAAILFPVFSQAREKARSVSCLSNCRQLGMGIHLYSQDYDEGYPFGKMDADMGDNTHMAGLVESWVDTVQPYVKSRLIHRCPSDTSPLWDAMEDKRTTTYGINAYFTPNHEPYFGIRQAQIVSPSQCIIVAELDDKIVDDHFMPMLFGNPSMENDPEEKGSQWDDTTQLPKSLSIKRHQQGANYVFTDGHAKLQRFEQTWHQNIGSPPDIDWYDPMHP